MTTRASLIVNADDYGFSPGVSAGIRLAHRQGIVTSTSVLIVAPSARVDLREAQKACPSLGIGVHLTLSGGWRPVLGKAHVRSFTNRRGRLLRSDQLSAILARAQPEEVLAEWRAQIEAVIDTGVNPDHLDAHHDVAYRSPALAEVLLELAERYKLPVRLPVAAPGDERDLASVIPAPRLLELAAARGVAHPPYMITGFGPGATSEGLIALLARIRPGELAELMCHPGRVDRTLRRKSSYTRPRERELAVLTGDAVRRWIQAQDVQLTTFASVSGLQQPGFEPG
jgi:predicted glycoside hydrolase/deacetylase ChbG (UPF0249 family)